MHLTYKKYNKTDFDWVMNFFRELYQTTDQVPLWVPQRFEYADYFVALLQKQRGEKHDWKDTIFLWEDQAHKIVGLMVSEEPDENLFVFTLPQYNGIQSEMITKAEEIIKTAVQKPVIKIWCADEDEYQKSLLHHRGYTRDEEEVEYLNWMDLTGELPSFPLPQGYQIQDMTDETGLDLQYKIDQITAAFDSPTYPVEIYRNLQKGPSYRKELDLYTTDAHGTVTSFCMIWYDKELKIGYLEPVGTDAQHRRKGLAQAIINVGLVRLKEMGAEKAYVGSYGHERMTIYKACGFTNRVKMHPWNKTIG